MKKHVIRLRSGEELVMRETAEGSVCPVCGAIGGGGLAWDWTQIVQPDGSLGVPFGAGSFDTCACCDTEYGNDDYVESGSIAARWDELRTAWLERAGWSSAALAQLRENLELEPKPPR